MLVKLEKKAQITLPRHIMEVLNLMEGDGLECVLRQSEIVLIPVEKAPVSKKSLKVVRSLHRRKAPRAAADYGSYAVGNFLCSQITGPFT